jgi:uncharacterized membrane protein
VWRGAGADPKSPPSRAFLVILWVITAALMVTAYRGGQNVYRYRVGVAPGAGLGRLLPQGEINELERI